MIFNHPKQFFPLLDASVPGCLRQRRSHRLQQGSIGPSVYFFVHLLIFFRQRVPQRKEVLVKDVNTPPHPHPPWWSYDSMRNVYMFRNVGEVLVKGVNTHPSPPPWWSFDSMCNVYMCRNVKEVYTSQGR